MSPELLSFLNTALTLAALLGGLIAFLRSRKTEIVRIQDETIQALQQQINAIKDRQAVLEKENYHLKQTIETIQVALKQQGIHITIDGEMVVIEEGQPPLTKTTPKKRITRIPTPKEP